MKGFAIRQPVISRRHANLLLLSGLLLPGCQTTAAPPPPKQTLPGGPVMLGVAAVDIINDYAAPTAKPHIDHLITPSPADQLAEWAGTTLTPRDDRGNLLMTINRAALIEQKLETTDGFSGLFKNEQSRLVRVELQGIFSFSHPVNSRSATLTVVANYESSIPDNSTPVEADALRLRVIAEGIGRFDMEFRKQLMAATTENWPMLGG